MVDRTLVLRKLSELEEYQDQLREFQGLTVAQYRADWKTQRIVERTLQMMIETCLDVANHLVADRGFRVPVSYADVFKVLGENKVLSRALGGRMEKMARFRNVLVHQYEGIEAEIIVGLLKKNLGDFGQFEKAVIGFLNRAFSARKDR
jgi:uncharacterized protein YutE (UPF0331/DUF86 family)